MPSRILILLLTICVSIGILAFIHSPLFAQTSNSPQYREPSIPRLGELTANELVQQHLQKGDNNISSEVYRRMHHAPDDVRAELFAVFLSVVSDRSRSYYHRGDAMIRLRSAFKPDRDEVFIDALISIITDDAEEFLVRDAALRYMPWIVGNQRALSALLQFVTRPIVAPSYLIKVDAAPYRLRAGAIFSIGRCGGIATDPLIELWNDEKFGYHTNIISALGLAAIDDERALDFLLSLLRDADLSSPESAHTSYAQTILRSLGTVGQSTLEIDIPPDSAPSFSPNPSVRPRVRLALERGMRTENRPNIVEAAARSLARMSRKGDSAAISRLQSVLPYLSPAGQKTIESYIKRLEASEPIITPPVDIPLMDRVPAPPTGSQ